MRACLPATAIYPVEAPLRLLIDAFVVGEHRVVGVEGLAADPLFAVLSEGVLPSIDTRMLKLLFHNLVRERDQHELDEGVQRSTPVVRVQLLEQRPRADLPDVFEQLVKEHRLVQRVHAVHRPRLVQLERHLAVVALLRLPADSHVDVIVDLDVNINVDPILTTPLQTHLFSRDSLAVVGTTASGA